MGTRETNKEERTHDVEGETREGGKIYRVVKDLESLIIGVRGEQERGLLITL